MNTRSMDYLNALASIKVNKYAGSVARHKPLLLLLAIAHIQRGGENRFKYDDLEEPLIKLLVRFGGRTTKNYAPQLPFVNLSHDGGLWECGISKDDLKHQKAPSRNELLGVTGKLTDGFVDFLRTGDNARRAIEQLVNDFWEEGEREEVLGECML